MAERTQRQVTLIVEYEGSNYAGFQLQPNQATIQGAIETALNRFTGENIRIRGASRTDSGAHALGQVVDFTTVSRYSVDTFRKALNHYLPVDIRVQQAFEMRGDFHPRRDAVGRAYRYMILNRAWPSPLRRRDHHWIEEPLQVEAMNGAAQWLVGCHDFRPLAPQHPPERSAVRRVYRWEVAQEAEAVVITCAANGFLYHQIRRANGILAQIGKGKWPPEALKVILDKNNHCEGEGVPPAWATMPLPLLPAHGLCLVEVTYRDFWSKVKPHYETN